MRTAAAARFFVILLLVPLLCSTRKGRAGHLSDADCRAYHDCLHQDWRIESCDSAAHLQEKNWSRLDCTRQTQHYCKVASGVFGKGKPLQLIRPLANGKQFGLGYEGRPAGLGKSQCRCRGSTARKA